MPRDAADEKIDARVTKSVMLFEHTARKYAEAGYVLISFTVRLPSVPGDEYLLVARVEVEGKPMVCFRNADYLAELLTSFDRALRHKTLKLREDRYAK